MGESPDRNLYGAFSNCGLSFFDSLGLAAADTMQGCRDAFAQFFKNNPDYKKRRNELQARGGEGAKLCIISPICHCCSAEGPDYFMNKNNFIGAFYPRTEKKDRDSVQVLEGVIHICYDKIKDGADFSLMMAHEFQHFADWCGGDTASDCSASLCSELRAFKAGTGCKNASDCWKYLEPYWKKWTKEGGKCAERRNLSISVIQSALDRNCNKAGQLPSPHPTFPYVPY